jgi:undecaprenyl diphosphate synthase
MQHLAIIPDGNRRWAAQHKIESFLGHKKGMEVIRTAINICIKKNIQHLSFYTFSLENFKRSDLEKNYLFNLLAENFLKELPELMRNGIRVRFIGDRSQFPKQLHAIIEQMEQQTENLSTLNLNLLFCYGATAEITNVVKNIAQKVKSGLLSPEQIDDTTIRASLWTHEIPDPDLIIRTGKQSRLSNFLLLQAAYSELMFLDSFWPDITEQKLEECIEVFNHAQRNFGK